MSLYKCGQAFLQLIILLRNQSGRLKILAKPLHNRGDFFCVLLLWLVASMNKIPSLFELEVCQ